MSILIPNGKAGSIATLINDGEGSIVWAIPLSVHDQYIHLKIMCSISNNQYSSTSYLTDYTINKFYTKCDNKLARILLGNKDV